MIVGTPSAMKFSKPRWAVWDYTPPYPPFGMRRVHFAVPEVIHSLKSAFRRSSRKELSTPAPRFAFGAACAGVDNSRFLYLRRERPPNPQKS